MKKIIGMIFTLVLGICLLAPSSALADAAVGGEYNFQSVDFYVQVSAPDGYVNFRYGPGLEYGINFPIYNGEVLHVTATQDNYYDGLRWGQCQYAGSWGWISISQTTIIDNPYAPQPTTAAQTFNHADEYVMVDAWDGYCNLRYGAGISYGIITPIYNGTVLHISQRSYNPSDDLVWGYTSYNGEFGWVSLSQTSPAQAPKPTVPETTTPAQTKPAETKPVETTTAQPETTTAQPETTTAEPETTTAEEETTAAYQDSVQARGNLYRKWLQEHLISWEDLEGTDIDPLDSPVIPNDYVYLHDVTGDGLPEMILTHYFDEYATENLDTDGDGNIDKVLHHPMDHPEISYYGTELICMRVYTVNDQTVDLINEYAASYSHIGWTYILAVPLNESDDEWAFLHVIHTDYQGVVSGGIELYQLTEDGGISMIENAFWDGNSIPDTVDQDYYDQLVLDGEIVLNTQYEDLEKGSCYVEDWLKGSSSGTQDGLSTEQQLSRNIWELEMDDAMISLEFKEEDGKMIMYAADLYYGSVYDIPVILAFSAEDSTVRIVDNSGLRSNMPSIFKWNYQLIYDRDTGILTLSTPSGDYTFTVAAQLP